MQQSIVEVCTGDLDPVGQHEAALELTRRDPRWRKTRAGSSRCLPRTTSWLSSIWTASSSVEKPATARLIRSRSSPICSML